MAKVKRKRNERIRAMRRGGATLKQIATEFGLSVSRVYAILKSPGVPKKRKRRDAAWPPEVRLATRIVELAITDWKRPPRQAVKEAQELGFASLREELEDFFRSGWCQELLSLLNCDLDLLELLRQADEEAP